MSQTAGTPFRQLLKSLAPEAGGFAIDLPEDWLQGWTAYGGLKGVLCVEAAARLNGDLPPLRSAHFALAGPASGRLAVSAATVCRGKSAVVIEAAVSGEAGPAARALQHHDLVPGPCGGGARQRADTVLAARGFAESRARARAAIEAGGVTADGRRILRPSDLVRPDAEITFQPAFEEVSRAAGKLKAAPGFAGAHLEGAVILDIGASTGGFTEVCLDRGAARVYAVDVGRGQLHPRLAADARVINLEATDARRLDAGLVPEPVQFVVCDASFISLAKVLPEALSLAAPGAWLFALVKPQFEVGPDRVGKGGVVRDPAAREAALSDACAFLEASGWRVTGTAPSPVTGSDGNLEFLVSAWKA